MSKDKVGKGGDYDVGFGKPPKEHQLAPRRFKWIPRWISNDSGQIGIKMAESCGSPRRQRS